jgi:excisionase family DNA binding protein
MTSETPKRLRVREVAALFDVGRDVIYRAIAAGLLPAERIGRGNGVFRVTDADVEAYRERCRKAAVVVGPARVMPSAGDTVR